MYVSALLPDSNIIFMLEIFFHYFNDFYKTFETHSFYIHIRIIILTFKKSIL